MSLSGGEKQRLVIGVSMISGKKFILFDEPTSGLDYVHMEAFAKMVKELKKQGKRILLITHDYELINLCCDATIQIKAGSTDIYSKGAKIENVKG